jgi:AdoMet-dependent rRNA methyltransferase SPB1
LTPEELAVGEMLVNSRKTKSDLIDDSYNRYSTFDDPEALPEWFVEDEKLHWSKDSVASKNLVSFYKKKTEDINARPIKKVVEAQARKKRKVTLINRESENIASSKFIMSDLCVNFKAARKMDKVKRKTEVITNNEDMTDREKSRELKQIYRKAGLISKKKVDVKYVVAKKGFSGKTAAKAKGVKGPYKVVDRRLRKDKPKPGRGGKKGGAKKGGRGAAKQSNKPKTRAMGGGGQKRRR